MSQVPELVINEPTNSHTGEPSGRCDNCANNQQGEPETPLVIPPLFEPNVENSMRPSGASPHLQDYLSKLNRGEI